MKLTKYEHACLTVEKGGNVLVIDPGNFSTNFIVPEGTIGVVITHEHQDHFDRERLAAIFDKNPEAILVAHPSIIAEAGSFPGRSVNAGDTITIGPFELEFFGGQHAVIHSTIPAIANLAVMINNSFYYPGDSFTLPQKPVSTLALPVAAPWLKLSESIDFLLTIKPQLALPTHDAILSDTGKAIVDRLIGGFASANNIPYERINETIDI